MELSKVIETCFTLQGKCERIKNFPLPRQYATVNLWFVYLFLLVVPFAIVGVLKDSSGYLWWTIPASVVLAWVFITWDRVANFSENPFEGLVNDIPMDALSRTIEIDLREMLGETELPSSLAAKDGILM